MKIAIDFRIFGTEPGGIGRYNQKLLEELIKKDRVNKYFLIFKKKPDIKLPENFKIVACDCHWYGLKEQLILPFVLRKIKPDLVHFTHFNVPIFYRGKFVVTIHDLIMTKFPSRRSTTLNRLFFGIKYWLYNIVISQAIKRAYKIIAVSKYGAADIKKHFSLVDKDASKIKVVYEGVTQRDVSEMKNIGLPKNFFIYVGNAYPHKNLEFLIQTFEKFVIKYPDYYLILVGNKNYFYERLKSETKNKNVIFTGHLPDDKLFIYYQSAKAYLFPSLYEGFGLPPLEAMASGLPVLSSNTSCLPEILGEAALFFDPKDKKDLLDKMEEVAFDQNLRDLLKEKGLLQVKKYSWSKMAEEIMEIYES